MAAPKHFLDLDRFEPAVLRGMLDTAAAFKRGGGPDDTAKPFVGKALALVFEKPSTRTRVSFELAIRQLGGEAIVLERSASQLGRGETAADTARVLSRYVDAIMIRTTSHDNLLQMAEAASVPVINGLTNRSHPCQLMADILTFEEHRGAIENRVVTWSGDGNNMAASWIHAAVRFNFELRLACPAELRPPEDLLAWAAAEGGRVTVTTDVEAAVTGADCVVTDAWVSMGDEVDGETVTRHNVLRSYQVNDRIMALAKPDAIFMHCLPAHRGDEVTSTVLDGPQSVIWDEAENRLHAQKGILHWCLS